MILICHVGGAERAKPWCGEVGAVSAGHTSGGAPDTEVRRVPPGMMPSVRAALMDRYGQRPRCPDPMLPG